jgi:RNA polymerase sigma factor (sigma-70 family)
VASVSSTILLGHIRRLVGAPSTQSTDRVLIERFTLGGDEDAFALLVSRHGPMVFRVCRYVLGNATDAEDAFQATFLVLARKAPALTWHESVAGWLHAVASRVALKSRAAARRRRTREALAPGRVAELGRDELSVAEAQTVLHEEVNRLPQKLRTALVLCYLEGMTQEEAARQAGLSLATLKRRLREGLELLRERLPRRGVALSALLSVPILSEAGFTPAMVHAVTRASVLFRLGLAAGMKTSPAAGLAQSVLKSMFLARLQSVGAVLSIIAALALGGTLTALQARTAETTPAMQTASAITTVRAKPTSADPPPDVIRAGVPLPPALAEEFVAVQSQIKGHARGVAFSPDGTRLAGCTGPPAGALFLWQAGSGQELWRRQLDCGATAIAFAQDGRLLAAAGDDRTVRLCDPETGEELRRLEGHDEPAVSLLFTPDHKSIISAGLDGTVRVWDRESGEGIRRFSAPGCALRSLALSPDGTLLAAGCDELSGRGASWVLLWDLPSGEPRPSLLCFPGGANALAFAPDKPILAAAGIEGVVQLWEASGAARAMREINPARWRVNPWPIWSLAFAAGGRAVIIGRYDGAMYVCDRNSGKLIRRLSAFDPEAEHGEPSGILSLAVTPDGKTLAAAGSDRSIRLWEIPAGHGAFDPHQTREVEVRVDKLP